MLCQLLYNPTQKQQFEWRFIKLGECGREAGIERALSRVGRAGGLQLSSPFSAKLARCLLHQALKLFTCTACSTLAFPCRLATPSMPSPALVASAIAGSQAECQPCPQCTGNSIQLLSCTSELHIKAQQKQLAFIGSQAEGWPNPEPTNHGSATTGGCTQPI